MSYEYCLGDYKWKSCNGHIYQRYYPFLWGRISKSPTYQYWPGAVRKVNWLAGIREFICDGMPTFRIN